MKQRFEKYDFDVLLLEGSYVSDPKVRRAVIEDGNDRCSVEEYASRYFRRQGYSALRVENEPIAALFGVFMSPLIQDASDPHGRMIGVGDSFAFDAGTQGKIIWTRLPDDFGKSVYGVRRAAAINGHLRTITGQSHQLRRLQITQMVEGSVCIGLQANNARTTPQEVVFSEADVARAELIRDLMQDLGVNNEGVCVILNLLDQMHGLRRALAGTLQSLRQQSAPPNTESSMGRNEDHE